MPRETHTLPFIGMPDTEVTGKRVGAFLVFRCPVYPAKFLVSHLPSQYSAHSDGFRTQRAALNFVDALMALPVDWDAIQTPEQAQSLPPEVLREVYDIRRSFNAATLNHWRV